MDFFEAQEDAKQSTTRLILFFILAVFSLIILTNLLVMFFFGYLSDGDQLSIDRLATQFEWGTFLIIGLAVGTVIVCGSLYKIIALSSGGHSIAESLGGQLIPKNSTDLKKKRLLNVVEEMAIASGTPVPPVYLLAEEQGINAFAAGFSPSDAVIGITKGTIEELNREQLQGVIGHEFSHILNGDMRLNIRLIGLLHGILLIGIIGYYLLRSSSRSRHRSSSSKNNGGAIIGLGIGLMVIGYTGTFFGNLIKASVSRHREYLADASAVQFTRNPGGIAGALKRIGGIPAGSRLINPGASALSHTFFSEGVPIFFKALLATHPPLTKRIRRIEPRWDGKFDTGSMARKLNQQADQETILAEDLAKKSSSVTTAAAVIAIDQAVRSLNRIGQPDKPQLQYAIELISQIPREIYDTIHEPFGARAVIYSLVINEEASIRDQQLSHLRQFSDPGVFDLTESMLAITVSLEPQFRLPIIDMCLPALHGMSMGQFQLFRKNLDQLIAADSKMKLFEWALQKILKRHLDAAFIKPRPSRVSFNSLGELREECEVLFSLLAYSGDSSINQMEIAFSEAAKIVELDQLTIQEKSKIRLEKLNLAVDRLALVKPLVKPMLLKACMACIMADEKINYKEIELMRAIADTLDCPMPPVVIGEAVVTRQS